MSKTVYLPLYIEAERRAEMIRLIDKTPHIGEAHCDNICDNVWLIKVEFSKKSDFEKFVKKYWGESYWNDFVKTQNSGVK